MGIKILSRHYGKGNNSDRFLIDENGKRFIIKFVFKRELNIQSKYTPKCYSIKTDRYAFLNKTKEFNFIYKYEFIDGNSVAESIIDDVLFYKIMCLFNYFFKNGYFVWDSHLDNIIIDLNNNPVFVDLGGIEIAPFNESFYVFSFEKDDFPSDYDENRNTETFIIYRVAFNLSKYCSLKISRKTRNCLNKMLQKNAKQRYNSFGKIIYDLKGK